MKTVLRLVFTYFTGTAVTRALTIAGLALFLLSVLPVTYLPQTAHVPASAFAGQLVFFLGSATMPLMFGRMAKGQGVALLPHGRVKLLASAVITVAIVALPAGLLAPVVYAAGNGIKLSDAAKYPGAIGFLSDMGLLIYTSLTLLAGWLYVAMWFLGSQRNVSGLGRSLVIIVLLIFVPVREIQELSGKIEWNLVQLAISWTVFGAAFLAWPRIKLAVTQRGWWNRSTSKVAAASDTWGREVALILGTHNPWLLVGALALPLLIATRVGLETPEIWLFFLTIFSVVTGAFAGRAASRSRSLWLRRGWSRTELFAEVERAFWRHNAIVSGMLLALMVGIGSYMHLRGELLAGGLPLLALGTALSTYLGFMITRGLRWIEIVLGSAVMLTLMTVSLLLGQELVKLWLVFTIEALLLGLVFVLRTVARRRWSRIDWIECRPPRTLISRQA
jgi:hypothetical protein